MRKNISVVSLPAILMIIFFSRTIIFLRKSAQLTSEFRFEQIAWSHCLQTCETRAFLHLFSRDPLTNDHFSLFARAIVKIFFIFIWKVERKNLRASVEIS